ncbi:MAG TPA: Yip1 family protein [Vicinamibacterales bacterium]|nr:Yip1 family protein [Vicinamibacterales bacterium]
MSIVDRARNICLSPTTEWPIIAAEPTTTGTLISGYVVPMAAIGAVAGFLGGSLIGQSTFFLGTYRVPLFTGLVVALFTFCMAIVAVFLVSLVINALAPSFGGQQDSIQALKVAVYSYTPAWIAGALRIVPLLGIFAIFAALYGLYLLFLGLPRLMKCPEDKALGYTAVVVVCAIVLSVVVASIGGVIAGAGMIGAGALGAASPLGGTTARRSSEIQFDKDSPMGKLQDLGKKLEESNKKMEAAQKKGDQNATAAAAVETLGTLLGGGKRVDPVAIDQLKVFVPDSLGGLAKTSSSAEKTGIAGLMVSKAEAKYGDGAGKSVTLEITDTGGVSGLMGFASWAGVEGEKDNDSATEKTEKVNGRLVHQRMSKRGGSNEFGIVLGNRFVVSANGNGVSLDELKAAVSGLDLAKLESMANVGVQQ